MFYTLPTVLVLADVPRIWTLQLSRLAVLATVIMCIPAAQYVWNVLRGHPMGGPSVAAAVANGIVERHLDPRECLKIEYHPFDFIRYPSIGSIRDGCIASVSIQTKDPSPCKLLLPSEYGLSCINDVIAQEFEHDPRAGFFDFKECSMPQANPLREDWCQSVRAHLSRSGTDCSPIRNDVIRAGCTLKMQAWDTYPILRGSLYFGRGVSALSP